MTVLSTTSGSRKQFRPFIRIEFSITLNDRLPELPRARHQDAFASFWWRQSACQPVWLQKLLKSCKYKQVGKKSGGHQTCNTVLSINLLEFCSYVNYGCQEVETAFKNVNDNSIHQTSETAGKRSSLKSSSSAYFLNLLVLTPDEWKNNAWLQLLSLTECRCQNRKP